MSDAAGLQGLRVLVLEDEALVAMLLEDMLHDLGCVVVGPAARVTTALELLSHSPQVALLDVNLSHGESGYPVAQALGANKIPFAFVTGYGGNAVDLEFRGHRTLQKPFHVTALVAVLQELARFVIRPTPDPSA